MNNYSPDYDISTGTTTIALAYCDGVVIAADSRTSCNTYVSNRLADKLTPITDTIYCCRSGSASQTQRLSKRVSQLMKLHEIILGEPPLVSDVAMTFRNHIYRYRDYQITGILVAGWDRRNGGQVYSLPVTGLMVREPYAVGGSGSTYIHGFVSSQYRPDLTLDETIDLAIKAVRIAIFHDCSSGGIVRVGVVNKDGIKTSLTCQHDEEICRLSNKMSWDLDFNEF